MREPDRRPCRIWIGERRSDPKDDMALRRSWNRSGAARTGVRQVAGGLMVLALTAVTLISQVSHEYEVKAVFLFNFGQFVTWPAEAFPTPETPLVIGILGPDPFGQTLDKVVKGERLQNRKVEIQRYESVDQIKLCHVLFISRRSARRLPDLLRELGERPILTVSEAADFVFEGGMIRMYIEKGKVRLRINPANVRAAHLSVSSRLLNVAEVVTPGSH